MDGLPNITVTQTKATTILKVENQDVVGKNWAFEIWNIKAGGANNTASATITSNIPIVLFASISCDVDTGVIPAVTIVGNVVTLTWAVAPASDNFTVKLEGND